MISISLCMIVKNEEDVIGRCLDSVKDIVDEIIIADTGSTDKTREIVSGYTDNIYDFQWIDNFAAARNFSFSKANKDYILWLDADDVFLEEDRVKFLKLKQDSDSSVDVVTMAYNLDFDEYNNVTMRNRRIRLVKRDKNFKWTGAVHEYLDAAGSNKVINSDICVSHKKLKSSGDRNIKIYEKMLEDGSEFTARDMYCYANELMHISEFEKAIEYYKKYLEADDTHLNAIDVCNNLSDCYINVNDFKSAREYCLKAFEYGVPGAEQCCRLGFYFFRENKINLAIFWLKLATNLERPENSWDFVNEPSWTWLPHVQLSMCYTMTGDYKSAKEHIEIAKKYRPEDEAILYNEKIIDEMINKGSK